MFWKKWSDNILLNFEWWAFTIFKKVTQQWLLFPLRLKLGSRDPSLTVLVESRPTRQRAECWDIWKASWTFRISLAICSKPQFVFFVWIRNSYYSKSSTPTYSTNNSDCEPVKKIIAILPSNIGRISPKNIDPTLQVNHTISLLQHQLILLVDIL